jgi:hypothetical protein
MHPMSQNAMTDIPPHFAIRHRLTQRRHFASKCSRDGNWYSLDTPQYYHGSACRHLTHRTKPLINLRRSFIRGQNLVIGLLLFTSANPSASPAGGEVTARFAQDGKSAKKSTARRAFPFALLATSR